MLRRSLKFFTVVSIIVFCLPVLAKEPMNLATAQKNAINYYKYGEYEYDIAQALIPAQEYLQERINSINSNNGKRNLAVVFDIDETLLSNFHNMIKVQFAVPPGYLDFTYKHNHTPIPPALDFYNFVKKNKVAIFLVTGRDKAYRQVTIKNLNLAGYTDFAGLYMAPGALKSAIPFKTACRKKIADQGYDIVLSVGDQYSDLVGGYADRLIKLPNPFYLLP